MAIKIASLNINSIVKHFDDLTTDFVLRQSDIICINESFLKPNEIPPPLSKYRCFSASKGRAAGVVVYVLEKFKLISSAQVWAEDTYQAVKLQLNKFDIISIYRSPKVKLQESFIDFVKNIIHINRPTIVCGDVNINFLKNPENIFTSTMS